MDEGQRTPRPRRPQGELEGSGDDDDGVGSVDEGGGVDDGPESDDGGVEVGSESDDGGVDVGSESADGGVDDG